MTTPVIRCLKHQTDSEIHLIVKNKFAEVLKSNPYISKIWTIEKDTSEIIEALRNESFDFVIDLHYNFRSILLTWQLKKPFLRFRKLNIEKWLMTKLKINKLPQKHLVERYFDSLQKLGIVNDGGGLDFFIDKEDSVVLEKFNLPDKYVIGVLGATYYTKQIPINKWIEIIQAIKLPIVFVGGANEKDMGTHFYREFPNQVFDCTGQLSIAESAAVIKNSQMVITPDTGMMHIAAALKKPIHVIWGNTIPQFGMYPYFGNENGIVKNHEVNGLACRPCTKLGYPACPKKHFDCMQIQKFDKQTMEF